MWVFAQFVKLQQHNPYGVLVAKNDWKKQLSNQKDNEKGYYYGRIVGHWLCRCQASY